MANAREILTSILVCEAADRSQYMRDYMRNRYHSVRDRVMKELGGKCARCGSKKDLQFDHINSSKKKLRMADIHSVSDARLQEELKNVQILCRECHHEKSHEAWDFNAPEPKHGTYWMYRKHGCRCPKCVKAYQKKQKQWKKSNRAVALLKLAEQEYLYHETQVEHLADIINDGIQPMSYGQSFVGNQGEMLSPDMFDEEELQDFPEEDLVQRTYVNLKEPQSLYYGNVLLRFPRENVQLKRDADWYTHHHISPDVIEVKVGDEWNPLRRHTTQL